MERDKIYHEGLNKFTFDIQMPKIQTLLDGKTILPTCIELSPSDVCTQSCYYCNTDHYRAKFKKSLKKKEFLDFIESVSHPGQVIKFVGGGEPLLNPHTIEAMKIAKENGAQNYIITNLEPIKPENLNQLLELCSWIRIGVDDFSEEVYNTIRRPLRQNGYAKVMRNIENLLNLRQAVNYPVNIGAQMVALRETVEHIYVNSQIAKELGFDFLQVRPNECDESLENVKIMRRAREEALRAGEELSDENFEVFPFEHKFNSMQEEYGKITNGERCYASNFFLIVGGGGDVFPCIYKTKPQYVLGNIYENSIVEILDSKKSLSARIKSKDCKSCCKYLSIDRQIQDFRKSGRNKFKEVCF